MTGKHRSRRIACLLLCCLLLFVSGCSAARPARPTARADKAVATAGNMEIPYENLYYVTMTRIAELKRNYGEDVLNDPAQVEELKTFVWKNLVTRAEALIDLGKEYGLDVDAGEIGESVQADMEAILENAFGNDRKAYIESLNAEFLTDNYVRTYLAVEDHLPKALVEVMLQRGVIDDSDEAARALMLGDDPSDETDDSFIRVRQVLIEVRNYGSAEEARARAEALRAKVAAKETDAERSSAMLDAMAYSTDLDMTGHGTYFAKGEMSADYEATAFSLPLYGVSEVIEVKNGYCFMMRLPKDQAYIEENFQDLKEKVYYVTLNRMVDERLATMTVVSTAFGDSLDLMDLPAIDADGGEAALVISIVLSVLMVVGLLACVIWYLWNHRRKSSINAKRAKK